MHRLTASPLRARMQMPSKLARLLTDPAVWKLTIMTSALPDLERQRYREAFSDFAARRGLQIHFFAGTTCIAPTNAPITSEDRGALLGWLCGRPEVHFIHVRRQPPRDRSLAVICQSARSQDAPLGTPSELSGYDDGGSGQALIARANKLQELNHGE